MSKINVEESLKWFANDMQRCIVSGQINNKDFILEYIKMWYPDIEEECKQWLRERNYL